MGGEDTVHENEVVLHAQGEGEIHLEDRREATEEGDQTQSPHCEGDVFVCRY
jgi:hypothetical protein